MNIIGVYGGFFWDTNKGSNESNQKTWVHDSGATLVIDGKLIASISEERLTRVKHEGCYPINSIDYCLSEGNISSSDIDMVVVPSMCIEIFYAQWDSGDPQRLLSEKFPNAEIKIISHHLSHAASAVLTSEFDEGTFVILDGAGSLHHEINWVAQSVEISSIGFFNKKKRSITFIPAMGHNFNDFGPYYYSAAQMLYQHKCPEVFEGNNMTQELWAKIRETLCGKIMGLCAYGSDMVFDENKHKIFSSSDEKYYNDFPYISFPTHLGHTLDGIPFLNIDQKAYLIQRNLELALLKYVEQLKEKDLIDDNLCLAGGVFLNVLANSVLKNSGVVENIHIPPYTSDTGLHLGAALYYAFKKGDTIQLPDNIALLGKEYNNQEIENVLKESKVEYDYYSDFDELCTHTSELINQNKIIAWFQGRSEHGPRALGSRSLLMSPSIPDGKDIMNHRVKHREYWRPFAGIILEEDLNEYFEEDFCSPYMLYSLTVKEDKRDKIPAITHKDNTCRIQTVNDTINPKVTKLLNKLKETCGSSVVLNTSFNDNGEPIVETPQDAVRSFQNMDIDYLVIGNFVVRK